MLSKTSIVITGMLLQGEMNAYDMLKMIDNMNMQYWHPIGATTLYESCLRLEKKGLIEDTGKSENKAVYRITEAGRGELKATICELFERVDYDSVWFCLAVMYSGILSKEELEKHLLERMEIFGVRGGRETLQHFPDQLSGSVLRTRDPDQFSGLAFRISSTTSAGGVLSMSWRKAVPDKTNSDSLKCSLRRSLRSIICVFISMLLIITLLLYVP